MGCYAVSFGYSVTQHNHPEDVDLNVFQLVTMLEAQKEI